MIRYQLTDTIRYLLIDIIRFATLQSKRSSSQMTGITATHSPHIIACILSFRIRFLTQFFFFSPGFSRAALWSTSHPIRFCSSCSTGAAACVHISSCVFIHVIYPCMYICMYACLYTGAKIICMRVCMHACIHACVFCAYMNKCIHTYIHACMHTCMHTYTHTHTHTHTHRFVLQQNR
jgi:hypothetical protein